MVVVTEAVAVATAPEAAIPEDFPGDIVDFRVDISEDPLRDIVDFRVDISEDPLDTVAFLGALSPVASLVVED